MGGSHIAIPTILKVGKGTLENLGTYIKSSGMSNAVIYFGNDLIDMFGETVLVVVKLLTVQNMPHILENYHL